MTFMMQICHLRIILHYVLKLDCDAGSHSRDMASQSFSTSDLEATLTFLDPDPQNILQNIYVRSAQNPPTRSGVTGNRLSHVNFVT